MMFLHTQRISSKKNDPYQTLLGQAIVVFNLFFTVLVQARILLQSEYFYFLFRILFPSNMYVLTIFYPMDKLGNCVFLALFFPSD